MTDTTDTASLSDQFKSIRDDVEFYEGTQHCIAVPIKLAKALLDRLEAERQRREAAEKERDDLLNQEFQQRLANAEHQLEMKDLAISNVKASRMAQFRKRKAAEAELERRDGLTGEMIYQERRFHVKGKSQIEYWADVNVSTYGYLHESQRRILYVAAGGIVKDGE